MQLFGIFFFARDHSDLRSVWPSAGAARTLLWVTASIGVFGLVLAPMFAAGTHGRDGHDGAGSVADGTDLRAARHGAFRTVSDAGALHGQLAGVQLRRHPRRFAGAVHRHVARHRLTACSTSATTSPPRRP